MPLKTTSTSSFATNREGLDDQINLQNPSKTSRLPTGCLRLPLWDVDCVDPILVPARQPPDYRSFCYPPFEYRLDMGEGNCV